MKEQEEQEEKVGHVCTCAQGRHGSPLRMSTEVLQALCTSATMSRSSSSRGSARRVSSSTTRLRPRVAALSGVRSSWLVVAYREVEVRCLKRRQM